MMLVGVVGMRGVVGMLGMRGVVFSHAQCSVKIDLFAHARHAGMFAQVRSGVHAQARVGMFAWLHV